jgi:signal transduction histidine kinase
LFDPNQGKNNFESIPSPLQSMQNMIAGRNGDLWIVASGGLLNYEVERKTWRRFDNRDGIPKSGLSNAMYWSGKNRLLLGGNGFILSCDPNALSMSTEKPKPRLTHVAIMDEVMDSLLAHEKFTLAHDKNFISFAFTGLCFSDPKAVVYEYRLDGLDEDWRLNGNDNKVSYSDLSPGDYNFRVRIKSLKGEHSLEEAHIAFVIQAPFYLRWWFLAIVAGLAGVVIWLIQKAIRLQRSRINNVRNKIARDLHDDIGSALGSISFFSETAKRTLNSRNAEGTQNILDKIGTTSREMIENMHDIVWAVGSNNDGMQQMIERMKTYAADMVAMNDVQLHFEVDKEMVGLRLSMTERKNIFLVFKEAVYNSHKYAACQNIRVQMKRPKNDRLYLTVFDDGIGFDVTKKLESGNGLGNMKNRMAEIGARMVIQSEAEQGTRLEIWLP